MNAFLQKISATHDLNLLEARPLSGGDINEVFLLKSTSQNYVVKINNADRFPGMFKVEAKGLQLLNLTCSFKIPQVIAYGTIENSSYLLLEYIPTGSPSQSFWDVFGENLVKLHKTTQQNFGLDHNNYIGSLVQYNTSESSASEFYINQRLAPQFKLAHDQGYQFSGLDAFFRNITEIIPNESPSLVHGDLWSGNYLVSAQGEPVLIDPAVAFAPREMDLAMMRLFGGFSNEVFLIYNQLFPLPQDWEKRIPLWQLYYILVHLNLFGSGYLSQTKSIISQFS